MFYRRHYQICSFNLQRFYNNVTLEPGKKQNKIFISAITPTKEKPAVKASTGMRRSSQVWSWRRTKPDKWNGPCSSLNGPQVSSSHDSSSPAATAEAVSMTDPFVPLQPESRKRSAGFRQSTYHLHHITRLIIGTMFPKPLQDSMAPMQMFLSMSCTCNPWSPPSKMLFESSFICILNTVILWNMMPRGRFSPFGSSGPELLNYWWNTDVISASGHKCTLLKKYKKCIFKYLILL